MSHKKQADSIAEQLSVQRLAFSQKKQAAKTHWQQTLSSPKVLLGGVVVGFLLGPPLRRKASRLISLQLTSLLSVWAIKRAKHFLESLTRHS